MAKVLVSKSDVMLLSRSESVKTVPELQDICIKLAGIRPLLTTDLEKFPVKQRERIVTIIPALRTKAKDEWYPKPECDDLGDVKTRCELCGTPNRYKYYIKNQVNQNEMHIGGDCIKHFEDILKRHKTTPAQLRRQNLELRKIQDLNNLIPGINTIIDKWMELVDSAALVLPKNIEDNYIELGMQIKSNYTNYINGKLELKECAQEIYEFLGQRNHLINDINAWISDHIDNPLSCNKLREQWIKQTDPSIIKHIKATGLISRNIVCKIKDDDFLIYTAARCCTILEPKGIKSWNPDYANGGYIINCIPFNKVNLLCSHESLLYQYPGLVFSSSKNAIPSIKDILDISVINDSNSYEIVLKELMRIFRDRWLSYHNHDLELDEILFKTGSQLYKVKAAYFIEKHKQLAYKVGTVKLDMGNYIRAHGQRYSEDKLKEEKDVRNEMFQYIKDKKRAIYR